VQLSRKALEAYNGAIKKSGNGAESAARKLLDAWFAENPTATVEQTRDFCISMLRELGTTYGQAAGNAAYALREAAAQAVGIELSAVVYDYAPEIESVTKTAHYQAGKLAYGDVNGFKDEISDAARYYAERGANQTMTELGKADGKKLGKRVRFARVPTGATTCPYCCMLASRGFVYRSELTALNANHRHCDCRIVEGFDGMQVEGYDPDRYYDIWKHPQKYVLENSSENREIQGKLFEQQRGQIDAGQGEVKSNDLASFNDKALQSIIDETGYDKQAAKQFQSSLQEWLGGDYEAFTRGEMQDHVAVIDAGLSRMGAYDSEMYRGMHFSNGSKIDMASFESFKTVQVGSVIEMKSVSSWTSEKAIAERYANIGSDGSSSVVLKCVSNKTAVGVQHISKWRTTEAEVLAPSGAKWRVVDVREVNMDDHTRNQLENGELSPLMKKIKARELAEKENELRGKTYVVIEVEEIG
jgi:hypothetical protein